MSPLYTLQRPLCLCVLAPGETQADRHEASQDPSTDRGQRQPQVRGHATLSPVPVCLSTENRKKEKKKERKRERERESNAGRQAKYLRCLRAQTGSLSYRGYLPRVGIQYRGTPPACQSVSDSPRAGARHLSPLLDKTAPAIER